MRKAVSAIDFVGSMAIVNASSAQNTKTVLLLFLKQVQYCRCQAGDILFRSLHNRRSHAAHMNHTVTGGKQGKLRGITCNNFTIIPGPPKRVNDVCPSGWSQIALLMHFSAIKLTRYPSAASPASCAASMYNSRACKKKTIRINGTHMFKRTRST